MRHLAKSPPLPTLRNYPKKSPRISFKSTRNRTPYQHPRSTFPVNGISAKKPLSHYPRRRANHSQQRTISRKLPPRMRKLQHPLQTNRRNNPQQLLNSQQLGTTQRNYRLKRRKITSSQLTTQRHRYSSSRNFQTKKFTQSRNMGKLN